MGVAASDGNVAFKAFTSPITDGGTLATTTHADVVVAAPGDQEIEVTTLASGVAVTGGSLISVYVRRKGNDAADTQTTDVGLLAIEVAHP